MCVSTCLTACGFKKKLPMVPLTTGRHGRRDLAVSYKQKQHVKYTVERENRPWSTFTPCSHSFSS